MRFFSTTNTDDVKAVITANSHASIDALYNDMLTQFDTFTGGNADQLKNLVEALFSFSNPKPNERQ